MRILFVSPYYRPAHLGGIERAIERLAGALRSRPDVERIGVLASPYAFPPRYVAGLPAHDVGADGLEVYRLEGVPRTPLPLFPYYSCPATIFPPRGIRRVLDEFRPDVLHLVGDGWVWVHAALLALRADETAAVFTPSFHDATGSRAWLRLPNTLICRRVERVVVLTGRERRGVAAAYRAPSRVLRRIPWGVEMPASVRRVRMPVEHTLAPVPSTTPTRGDPWGRGHLARPSVGRSQDHFPQGTAFPSIPDPATETRDEPGTGETPAPQATPLTILCVGRLGEHKGQMWLLDAYLRARRRFARPARLVLVGADEGDAGGRVALERRIHAEGLSAEVELTGEVTDDELQGFYAGADLFALFSRYEAFGLVYVEAMAHGVPVLTHRVGANAEVLARGAVLTAPYAMDAAADALVRLVNDEEERRRLGEEARSYAAATFSWDTVAARYLHVYEEAMCERQRRQGHGAA